MALNNPYAKIGTTTGRWYKGSLHVHSDVNEMYDDAAQKDPRDRGRPRERVLEHYKSTGHDFVMFAEQNIYTVEADIEAEGLNINRGILVIPGAEFDRKVVTTGQHLSHVNASH